MSRDRMAVIAEWEGYCRRYFEGSSITEQGYRLSERAFYSGFASCLTILNRLEELPTRVRDRAIQALMAEALQYNAPSGKIPEPPQPPASVKEIRASDPADQMLQDQDFA